MSIIAKSLSNIASTFLGSSVQGSISSIAKLSLNNTIQGSISNIGKICLNNTIQGFELMRRMGSSLHQMHRRGPFRKPKAKKSPLDGKPFAKGVVLKTLIKKPKKPNSANRKCVLVRLSTGKEMVAYVPGIGHNLQEHNIVLCRVGKLQDTPGVKIKCVRGVYDLPHVVKQTPNK